MRTAEYHRPWETHARMEPINATVSVTPGRVDVWSPTQDQSTALELAADQAGVSLDKVFVHTVFLGGGFGGNGGGATAVTRQATELSKRLKRPVKVIWSREEDMAQDKQRRAGRSGAASASRPGRPCRRRWPMRFTTRRGSGYGRRRSKITI